MCVYLRVCVCAMPLSLMSAEAFAKGEVVPFGPYTNIQCCVLEACPVTAVSYRNRGTTG